MRTPITRLVAVLAAVLIVASACSSSSSSKNADSPSSNTSGNNATPAAQLPDRIKSAGKIVVGVDASYLPMEFFAADGTTAQGADIDLARALGEALGVQIEIKPVTLTPGLPELGTKLGTDYDVLISSVTDTQEFEQSANFVTYFSAGSSLVVATGQNQDLTSAEALCGKNVGVMRGSAEAGVIDELSTSCTGGGKTAITVTPFPDRDAAVAGLESGPVQVLLLDSPGAGYLVKNSGGKIEVIGKPINMLPFGIAVSKSDDYAGMTDALVAALKQLNVSGKYTEVLQTWGVQSGAITDFQINGAVN
jgi:polar amino acid transport system substrate-binding protein